MYILSALILVTATLVSALQGPRKLTFGLSFVSIAVAVAVYFHHADSALPLSF